MIQICLCFLIIFNAVQELSADDWKTQTIGKLTKRAQSESNALARKELESQLGWLRGWQPGKMSAEPTPNPRLPEKRVEPQLKSPHLNALRNKLKELDADQARRLVLECSENPKSDLAVLQACLQWMDNTPPRRKQHLDAIDSLTTRMANRVISELGAMSGNDSATHLRFKELDRLIGFLRYRRVRALAYRELPDVVSVRPIKDQERLNQQIDEAFNDLINDAGSGRIEFVLIEVRLHRRSGNYGLALALLEKSGPGILPKWYQKKRRDLLKELNWNGPYREAAKIYEQNFPDEVAKERMANTDGG